MAELAVILILSYLVGSIPTGIIVSKMVKGIDIREHGSGNMGGTNAMRVLGWKYGLLVLVLDAIKGAVCVVFIARLFDGSMPFRNATPFDDFTLIQLMAGVTAVIGHIWTVFAGFRGGKGIATGLGILAVLATVDLLIGVGVFLIVVYFSRYVSLGSILGTATIPLALIIRENVFNVNVPGYHTILPFIIGLTLLVVYTHRKNIIRIANGSENKLSFKKKAE